ncbi:MAG: aspartate--tRNA ligase [Patescibacteria group bacterium]
MAKTEIISLNDKVNNKVTFEGWIDSIRDHGNLIFLDIRDRSGTVQVVIFDKKLIKIASEFNPEDLISVTGKVQRRPEKLINTDIVTGKIEVAGDALFIISKSKQLPFEINQSTEGISETLRLKYRYLDLRNKRMKNNLFIRHRVFQFLRDYLNTQDFWEIETPSLTKGTPEGAREYIVPSRLQEGKFYVLPQSPQQFKQLLMVGGIEKYYQIARCFRDEDQRGDRQPEFTQLDMEMSFVGQEDILNLLEKMMISMIKSVFPEKKISATPFPRITYKESIQIYKSDKPDLRKNKKDENELSFCWIIDFPMFEYSDLEKKTVAIHHPFTRPKDEDIELLDKKPLDVRASAYDLVLNGTELGSGSLRIHESSLQEKVFEILELKRDETKTRFGHMLEAFEYSPPPHGGFAFGLDRLLAVILNQKSIREVIAFPKTGDAKDPLMGAPEVVSEKVLREAHIKLRKTD